MAKKLYNALYVIIFVWYIIKKNSIFLKFISFLILYIAFTMMLRFQWVILLWKLIGVLFIVVFKLIFFIVVFVTSLIFSLMILLAIVISVVFNLFLLVYIILKHFSEERDELYFLIFLLCPISYCYEVTELFSLVWSSRLSFPFLLDLESLLFSFS